MAIIAASGSIVLHCQSGGSNKDYIIESYNGVDASNGQARFWRTRYGSAGRANTKRDMGAFDLREIQKLMKSKVNKGYEIVSVNGKPALSQELFLALDSLDKAGTSASTSMHPMRKIEAKEVTVTFDEGQFAPIW